MGAVEAVAGSGQVADIVIRSGRSGYDSDCRE